MADYKELESIEDFDIFDGTFESVKDNLFMRLFNKRNLPFNKQLDDIPYISYADLAITFSIEQKAYFDKRKGINSYLITNEDMKRLNVNEDILKEIAMKNVLDKNSVRIETIQQHIIRTHALSPLTRVPNGNSMAMLNLEGPSNPNKPSTLFNGNQFGPLPIMSSGDTKDILLISNRTQTFASINIVMPEVLDEVYQEFKENFYIVPSSIHELICIKSSYVMNDGEKTEKQAIEDLEDMVEQINDVVHNDTFNILSYNIYYHMHEDKCTMIVT